MITKQDLERILVRESDGKPVLSLFLDMSVNENNKRLHRVFLSQKRAQMEELGPAAAQVSDLEMEAALSRATDWLEAEFDEANRGVVIYAEIGGEWFEALQFPVVVQNRLVVAERPVVGPLAQVLEGYRHHGVVLLDREHVRLLSVYLGTVLDEITVRGEPLPAPSHVQAGGYSQMRFQRRKAEEMRHFFKEFAREVEEFVARYGPDDLVLLGTPENTAKFTEFLPQQITEMVVHTGPMPVDQAAPEVLARLEPHLRAAQDRSEAEVLAQVRDRVAHDYLAIAGVQSTLTALQEGKVDTLVLASNQRRDGRRCGQCGFVFARTLETCPYDGSTALETVEVMEEMVRMAEGQGVPIAFAEPGDVQDLAGAAALLRF
ncbi:MAG TPA: VLRF1 family aeRF1-type release factor [Longimicrobiaceae bacterium]|nr:VLRF1 family aeRF1-type release factor [Longimicrobiaceae bacterium]